MTEGISNRVFFGSAVDDFLHEPLDWDNDVPCSQCDNVGALHFGLNDPPVCKECYQKRFLRWDDDETEKTEGYRRYI